MSRELMNEFFAEDCDAAVRQELVGEINRSVSTDVTREYTFNRFNLRMNFRDGTVLIGDELNVSDEGSCSLSLEEFSVVLSALSE
jgi:hypothetical protein